MKMWPTFNGGTAATTDARERRVLSVYARLKPGVSLAQAQAEVRTLGAHLADAYPSTNKDRTLAAEYEQEARRQRLQIGGIVSVVVVGLILLLACANVAGLLLGRSEARRGEIAVRLALGASRGRLVRQLLTESVLLSLMGAAAGLLLAFWLLRLIPSLIPAMPITFNFDFRIDLRVMAATLVASALAAPVFGLLPALAASRPDLVPLLKGATADSARRRLRRFAPRNVLVVGQIAVSLALLVSSGLLVRSFLNMRQIDPGFVARPMVFSTMAPQALGYDDTQRRDFYRALLERLSATPGVERATMAAHLPLNTLFGGGAMQKVVIPGYRPPTGDEALQIRYNVVEPAYFETMGIRLVKGRSFTGNDRAGASPVVLINQTMARRFWTDRDPIGTHITVASVTAPSVPNDCEVIGVVQDGKYLSLDEAPQPYLYLPYAQQRRGEMTVIARVRGDARSMIAEFRRQVWRVDAAMPIMQVTTMDQHMQAALVVERALAAFVGVLGGLGLLLSVVGLYGVISFLVSRRTREIGIRMALGAQPADVVRGVLADGSRLALVGVGIGLALAAVAMAILGEKLYGISWWDPPTYVAMAALVLLVALGGSYAPARRAARVDPLRALRTE
jgi:putative ABC transport system permease protein